MEYKGYDIVSDGTYGMKLIKKIGPGTCPYILQGSYTKIVDAQHAIDQYVLVKEERDNKPPAIKKVKLFPRGVEDDAESCCYH